MHSAAFIHPSLNRVGGAEKVLLDIIEYFRKKGYTTYLYTIEKTDWEKIHIILNYDKKPDYEYYLNNKLFSRSTIQIFFYIFLLIRAQYAGHKIILNNYGEVFPFISKYSYIHAKPLVSTNYIENPYNFKFPKITYRLYRHLFNILNIITRNTIILTNSKYNLKIIEKFCKKPIYIVYPYTEIKINENVKNNYILTISRITPKKELYMIKKIAKILTQYKFFIAGNINDENKNYIDFLFKNCDNIQIIKNPNRKTIENLLICSRIYLATQKTEAFGIAIIEAMGNGCIPVIPRSGGPWTDIFEKRDGEVGFTYTNIFDAVDRINLLFENPSLIQNISSNARKRGCAYSKLKFEESLEKIFKL